MTPAAYESMFDLLGCLLRRQAGYVDAAQKAEGNGSGIGHPGVLFHLWRVVDLKVQQIARSDQQALLLRRQTGRKLERQEQ